jgi:hypothetical protein
VGYHCLQARVWKPLLIFTGSYLLIAYAFIAPLTRFNFSYWFNYGQPPHTARISPFDLIDELMWGSQWIKFYLLLVVVLAIGFFRSRQQLQTDRRWVLFFLLTTGILVEAAILQVTSYTPPDNNIFFHSFAFAFLLTGLKHFLHIDFSKMRILLPVGFALCFWWSGVFWKYLQRVVSGLVPPASATVSPTGENVVNRHTYMRLGDASDIPMSEWTYTGLRSFDRIYMPKPTVDGIHRLLKMPIITSRQPLQVLNMTELTPLAVEMPYTLPKGPQVPLWHHLGVGMFNREAQQYETDIVKKRYDLVLFEHIPNLNNFYPFRVRDSLLRHYQRVDSFLAPRRGVETKGMIEVYVK